MPVPKDVRIKTEKMKELSANLMKYHIANIDNKVIFLQEAEWVLHNKSPIPTGKLVAHKDGNPLNCAIENLYLVDEGNDFHAESNKVFHEHNLTLYKDFIKEHFYDIYEVLFEDSSLYELD
jgi:hypothetical protein